MIGHMVGHNILQPAHTFAFDPSADFPKPFHITNFLVDNKRISYIIAMRTSLLGLEKRRGVNGVDLKTVQIVDDFTELFQSKSRGQLNSISRYWDRHFETLTMLMIYLNLSGLEKKHRS